MSKLIIAEKPSVAKSIASALGASSRADGFYEGNGLLVSWCVGHLVSPMDAGGYDERFKKWRYDDLPILPEPFRYVLVPGKEDTFENLRALMNRPDVDTIVNACDAGREGELIFRLVYEMTGCRKPVLRLWISSMEAVSYTHLDVYKRQAQEDKFDTVRALYPDMLRGQLEHGNNGMVKTKFLVLTIEAKNSNCLLYTSLKKGDFNTLPAIHSIIGNSGFCAILNLSLIHI